MLASTRWKGVVPKFNNPEAKAELASFASEITTQCGMPEVGFNEDGIIKHVQANFNEQRRYRRNKSDSKVTFSLLHLNFFHATPGMPWHDMQHPDNPLEDRSFEIF